MSNRKTHTYKGFKVRPRGRSWQVDFGTRNGTRQQKSYPSKAERATWTNTIGAPELITVWKDPEFDPQQRAFYYARVLEIPTPRWTAYDAVRFGLEPPEGARMTIVERAYTSPIWYTP